MTTNDDAVACFTCVSSHLRPGGMLLLELAHPGERAAHRTAHRQQQPQWC
jgi:hypothetical protein